MKKVVAILSLLTFLTSVTSNANESVALEKGQPAPFAGVLLSNSKANDVKVHLLERDTQLKIITIQKNTIDLYEANEKLYNDKVNILLQQNDKLAISLNSARETTNWERAFYFILGTAATALAVYGAKKVTQ